MKILITGAKGFLGSHLAPVLKKQGHETVLFAGDVAREKNFNDYKDKNIETVIHLASKLGGRDKKEVWEVNVEGTRKVVEFCQTSKVKRLIFLSSIKVLSSLSDPYINSKKEGEKIVQESGVPYIIVRPSMLYGPGDKKNIGLLAKMAKKLLLMPVLDFRVQPLLVEDLVKIIFKSVTGSDNKILNIVGPEIVSCLEIYKEMRQAGFKFRIINWPCFFTVLVKVFSRLPGSPLPLWQIKSLFDKETFKGDNWAEEFRIKPTGFSAGIKKI